MSYIGIKPAESFTSFATQTFSTSATSSYTLDHAVTNENELALFINNVRQQPGSGNAYTATGTALTLSANTASTDTMYAVFLGRALQTVNPPAGSVGSSQIAAEMITGTTALAAEPADTDEFLLSDAGTLKRIDYSYIKGGGKILQVVSMTHAGEQTISSSTNTYNDTGLTLAITPSATSSKILIMYNLTVSQRTNDGYVHATIKQVISGGSAVDLSGTNYGFTMNGTDIDELSSPHSFQYIDSPNTTSATTYTIQTRSSGSSQTYRRFRDATTGSLILMEVGA